jgi:hypothetical protein
MWYGICNVTRFYKAGSPLKLLKELSNYMFDLVSVQKIKWEDGGAELAGEQKFFFYRKGNENHELGTSFCA